MGILEKIQEIEKEMARTQKNKGKNPNAASCSM
jgi:ribosome-interacting GTPase 1